MSKWQKRHIVLAVLVLVVFLRVHGNLRGLSGQFRAKYPKNYLVSNGDTSGLNLKQLKFNSNDLRSDLSKAFPYDPSKPIPRRVWQTWKVPIDSPEFPGDLKPYVSRWESNSYEVDEDEIYSQENEQNYYLLSDDQIESILESFYGEVPIIVQAYKLMPSNILKADFVRYLLLYARGGIYSDIDTFPLKDFRDWPSMNREDMKKLKKAKIIPYKNFDKTMINGMNFIDPGLVVGIEADPDRPDWADWYSRRVQFCQWTIQSKPGHPVLRELILNITATTIYSSAKTPAHLKSLIDNSADEKDFNINYRHRRRFDKEYDHSQKKQRKNVDGTDIMNWTGPGIFSDSILNYLTNIIRKNRNILLLNSNLDSKQKEIPSSAAGSQEEEEEEDLTYSTKKFYNEISTSLLSSAKMPWEFFSLITEPLLVDDIMVLPITSFSPDVMQMQAESSQHELALVKHMFHGSWKEEADGH